MNEVVSTTQIKTSNIVGYSPLRQQPLPLSQSTQSTTTVVLSQPQRYYYGWSSGICGCFQDMKSCCCAFCLGHCYYACLASRMGENCCVGLGWVPGGHLAMRAAFRREHQIPGSICDDSTMICYCLPCTMCQLAREMDHLDYPPATCC